jgi:hypothetical protein
MGTFSNSRFYPAPSQVISQVVSDLTAALQAEGYEVKSTNLFSGGADVSVTKGGVFKSVIGMKSALKVVIRPSGSGIAADASVGIFGQQVVPTLITMLVFWPVLLTQIWGLVRQSKIDDHVLDLIGTFASRHQFSQTGADTSATGSQFCTQCGSSVAIGSKFCNECGHKM